jgi:hypothetical protein
MVYVQLLKSKLENKRYTAFFFNKERKKIKTTHFGLKKGQTFIDHKDEERKQRYLNRHEKNENWNDYMSSGSLSRWLLWHKPSLAASYSSYLKNFNLKKF